MVIDEHTKKVDQALAEISRQLKMLYYLNPTNTDEERATFFRQKGRHEPAFAYNPLNFDRDLVRRYMYSLPVEKIGNLEVQSLYRQKRSELDQMLALLDERCTDDFTLTSEKLYGAPAPDDVEDAHSILEIDPEPESRTLDAIAVKERLQKVVDSYRAKYGRFECHIMIRKHLAANAAAGERSVAIKTGGRFSENDAQIFGVHEIGWHVLTANNAALQPLEIFAIGLPGFLGAQEGGAIFAEYMAGALTVNRLRILAGRTLAVHLALAGQLFSETYAYLMARPHGFSPEQAFSICERAYRGGGPKQGRWHGIYSKDGIYQRYFIKVFNAWLSGSLSLEAFLVGKMDLTQIDFVQRGIAAGIFRPALFIPTFCEDRHRLKLTKVMTQILSRRESAQAAILKPPPAALQPRRRLTRRCVCWVKRSLCERGDCATYPTRPNDMICPICHKPFEADAKDGSDGWAVPRGEAKKKEALPFCSRRCKLIDLGAWLTERYTVPDNPTEDDSSSDDSDGTDSYNDSHDRGEREN